MAAVTNLAIWAPNLPEALVELPDHVARILGTPSAAVTDPVALGESGGPALIVLTGCSDASVFRELDPVIADRTAPTALVIGDGWIGTEGPDVASALIGAGAVALARSIAVRRRATGRVNVVCIPESLIGAAGSQHGPLLLQIGSADIADVVAFVLGDQSFYIDGQVLYADGGRQLFSSLTA